MKRVQVGSAVKVVDEHGVEHNGLVTANWQNMDGIAEYDESAQGGVHIALNITFVSNDPAKTDQYGRQLERHLTSVMHKSVAGGCPGRYWYQL